VHFILVPTRFALLLAVPFLIPMIAIPPPPDVAALPLHQTATPTPTETHEQASARAQALGREGVTLYERDDFESALIKFQEALALFEWIGDRENEAIVHNYIGLIYERWGRYQQAVAHSQKSLEIYKEIGDRESEATAHNNMGIVYQELGEYQQALEHGQKALLIHQEVGDREGEALAHHNIGAAHDALGEPHQALEYYQRALEIRCELGDQTGEAQSYNNIGMVYYQQGEYQRALEYFQRSLPIFQKAGDRYDEEIIYNNIGGIYHEQGELQQASEYYQKALEIRIDIGDRAGEAESYNNLGGVYKMWGEYQQALEYYQKGLDIRLEIGDRAGQASSYHNLAAFYDGLGDYRQALEYYQKGLKTAQEIGIRYGEAHILSGMGLVWYSLSEYQQALTCFQESLRIRQEIGDRPGEASACSNMGLVYIDLGKYRQALEYLQEALAFYRQAGDHVGEATTLHNIASVYNDLGEHQLALENNRQVLEIVTEMGFRYSEAECYNNTGGVYADMGECGLALEYYQKALPIYQEIGDRSGEAASHNNVGTIYLDLGQYSQALEHLQRAVEIRLEMDNRAGVAQSYRNLGFAYKGLGENQEALEQFQQALEAYEEVSGRLTIGELRSTFVQQHVSTYEQVVSLSLGLDRPAEAFESAERARARAFLDQLGNYRLDLRAGADPTLVEQEQQLSGEIAALTRSVQEEQAKPSNQRNDELAREIQSRLDEKRAEYADLLVQLKLSSPEYASLVSVAPLSLEEIQSEVLGENVTLIEYFVAGDQTIAFVLTRDRFQAIPIPVTREALTNRVAAFRDLIALEAQQPDERLTRDRIAVAQALFNTLLSPLSPHLSHHTLVIVPHGVLHYLPFAALADEEGTPLAARYTLSLAPIASALSYDQANRNPDEGRLLALGDPTTDLPPLAFAESEVQAISTLYASPSTLLGPEASEAAFRTAAPSADWIHLAVHGEFNPVSPLFSTLHLAGEPTADDSTELAARTALASEADGRLEVHEVYGLDLREANLVVLSACQTQLGELSRGDELVGLTRAFLYAGTPTVVATLWEVDDEATGVLMAAFHRHLREGMGPAAALRAAQEEVHANEKWAVPYYWAGVQVIGDGGEARGESGEWREEKVTPMVATSEAEVGSVAEEAGQGERWVLWIGGVAVGMGVVGAALFALRRRNP